ncbi:MAG: hypothetical protein HC906_12875 [Bacteroidales bacterium]|nr:hypothetical protein [Bacteroidales bacterium]
MLINLWVNAFYFKKCFTIFSHIFVYMLTGPRKKIIDYLFDLLPKSQKEELQREIESDDEIRSTYLQEKENIIIESYLNSELPGYEKVEFERRLHSEHSLKKEVELRKKVNAYLQEVVYKDQLEESYHQMHS